MGRDNEAAGEVQAEATPGIETFVTSVSSEENARKLEISHNFGGSTAGAVEIYGEEAVYGAFLRGAKVALQGNIRAKLSLTGEDAKTDEDIIAEAVDWKPGARSARGMSKTAKVERMLDAMGDEEREALLAKLMEAQG